MTSVDKPSVGAQPPKNAGAGSAGAGSAGTELPPDNQLQIVDDVDHPDGQYPQVPAGSSAFFWRGGLGNWFVSVSDGSAPRDASVDDVIPPRGESTKAYHIREMNPGTAVDLWAQLNHLQGTAVDLSPYSGIAFWARQNSHRGELTVAFGANGQFANVASMPQRVVLLSENWVQFVVRFDDLGLKSAAVSSIDFVVADRGQPLDLWVDDLAFLCRSTCP